MSARNFSISPFAAFNSFSLAFKSARSPLSSSFFEAISSSFAFSSLAVRKYRYPAPAAASKNISIRATTAGDDLRTTFGGAGATDAGAAGAFAAASPTGDAGGRAARADGRRVAGLFADGRATPGFRGGRTGVAGFPDAGAGFAGAGGGAGFSGAGAGLPPAAAPPGDTEGVVEFEEVGPLGAGDGAGGGGGPGG